MRSILKLAVIISILFAWSPVRADDDLTRDQLLDAMVSLTQNESWNCDGSGCSNLRAAFPRFLRKDDNLFIESLVRSPFGNFPFQRAVMVYRDVKDDWRKTPTWELYFQVESYLMGNPPYPMVMTCQPDSIRQFRCVVTEGVRFAENNAGFTSYVLTWSR
jgi:hypothetical protein